MNQPNSLLKQNMMRENWGLIQGRLTTAPVLQHFPDKNWKEEFYEAPKAGYAAIECFRDKKYNKYNPLWNSDADVCSLKETSAISGTFIRSICDDYVMCCDWNRLDVQQYIMLEDIIFRVSELGGGIIVFPLMEKAEINDAGSCEKFIFYIKRLSKIANVLNLQIALEISKNSDWIYQFLKAIDCDNVGLCVDTGNLFASGIPAEDILRDNRLRDKIIHVHLKDRDDEGNNVIPGTGRVNFKAILQELFRINYKGMLVTETTRGNDPLITAKQNKAFFEKIIAEIANTLTDQEDMYL